MRQSDRPVCVKLCVYRVVAVAAAAAVVLPPASSSPVPLVPAASALASSGSETHGP